MEVLGEETCDSCLAIRVSMRAALQVSTTFLLTTSVSQLGPNTGIIIRGRSYWENPAELEKSLTVMLEELSTESTL